MFSSDSERGPTPGGELAKAQLGFRGALVVYRLFSPMTKNSLRRVRFTPDWVGAMGVSGGDAFWVRRVETGPASGREMFLRLALALINAAENDVVAGM